MCIVFLLGLLHANIAGQFPGFIDVEKGLQLRVVFSDLRFIEVFNTHLREKPDNLILSGIN